MKRAIPELSIDTQALERELMRASIGDLVTYATLSASIGRDVQHAASHLLASARRRLQREHAMLFEPVRGDGLKRLDDIGIVGSTAAAMDRVRNIARRQRHKLGCVRDFDALPNDAKVRHNVAASVFGVLGQLTKDTSLKKLESKMSNGKHDALPVAKFLDAMRQSL